MNAQDLLNLIRSRRTQKDFTGAALSEPEIRLLLEAANWAPNHRLNQPWRFRVFTQKGCKSLIESFRSSLNPEDLKAFEQPLTRIEKIGALIFVSHQIDANEAINLENYAATCAGIQNMLLMAESMGYQSYWSTSKFFNHSSMLKLIDFKDSERLVGALWFGRGEKSLQAKTRKAAEEFTQCFK